MLMIICVMIKKKSSYDNLKGWSSKN